MANGLNASTGEFLWDYATDNMVWNYYPIITDDGESIVFQDSTGQVYRVGLDGKEMWKSGITTEGWRQTWTDGGIQLGPNGVVYAMKALGGDNVGPGIIKAFQISDGKMLWESEQTPEVPNAWPIIGHMRKGDPLTVITPIGKAGGHFHPMYGFFGMFGSLWQSPVAPFIALFARAIIDLTIALGDTAGTLMGIPPMYADVWGLDAETGKTLWKWNKEPWLRGNFKGEHERARNNAGFCVPNPVGNPTLDANGNVYVGFLDGFVYHLTREDNGPGIKVQSKYDAESDFSSGGVSIAPGMMVIVSCEEVLVFKGEA